MNVIKLTSIISYYPNFSIVIRLKPALENFLNYMSSLPLCSSVIVSVFTLITVNAADVSRSLLTFNHASPSQYQRQHKLQKHRNSLSDVESFVPSGKETKLSHDKHEQQSLTFIKQQLRIEALEEENQKLRGIINSQSVLVSSPKKQKGVKIRKLTKPYLDTEASKSSRASSDIKHQQNIHINNYEIKTPSHSDIHPTECALLIEDIVQNIVSDDGIDPEALMSCSDKIRKYSKKMFELIPKCTLTLNGIRKCVALWSTAFMIDCKLTDGGHFGAECTSNIRVIPADLTTIIHQHHDERLIMEFDIDQKNCFLPYCSAIHPSTLDRNRIKHPEIYKKCFSDQCEAAKCDKAPSNAKCEMKSRSATNIRDWCIPRWYDPNRTILAANVIDFDGWEYKRILDRQWRKLLTYSIDCETGQEWYVSIHFIFPLNYNKF